MILKKQLNIIIALMLWFTVSIASAAQINVTGYGTTLEEAERDAMRNAVEQAVGTMVDSSTLIENNVLINDEIYTQSRGYITNYTVLNQKVNNGTYEITINADVNTDPNSKLMNELTRLGIINRQLRDPKIAIIIPEYHNNEKMSDGTCETAIIKKLTQAGFSRITDVSDTRYNLNMLSAVTKNDMENVARSLNVDILIVGEAFSDSVGDVGKFLNNGYGGNVGIISCRAHMNTKIFISKTGQIISADEAEGTAADLTELIAGKKALKQASEKMGDFIIEQLLNYGSAAKQNLEIVVHVSDFNKVQSINKTLQSIRGVNNSMITDYNNGRATISLKYAGTPQTLFNQLNQHSECSLTLQEISYNTLIITAY